MREFHKVGLPQGRPAACPLTGGRSQQASSNGTGDKFHPDLSLGILCRGCLQGPPLCRAWGSPTERGAHGRRRAAPRPPSPFSGQARLGRWPAAMGSSGFPGGRPHPAAERRDHLPRLDSRLSWLHPAPCEGLAAWFPSTASTEVHRARLPGCSLPLASLIRASPQQPKGLNKDIPESRARPTQTPWSRLGDRTASPCPFWPWAGLLWGRRAGTIP